jgi:hypothetical protein
MTDILRGLNSRYFLPAPCFATIDDSVATRERCFVNQNVHNSDGEAQYLNTSENGRSAWDGDI